VHPGSQRGRCRLITQAADFGDSTMPAVRSIAAWCAEPPLSLTRSLRHGVVLELPCPIPGHESSQCLPVRSGCRIADFLYRLSNEGVVVLVHD
jgi:hypothetical protein